MFVKCSIFNGATAKSQNHNNFNQLFEYERTLFLPIIFSNSKQNSQIAINEISCKWPFQHVNIKLITIYSQKN